MSMISPRQLLHRGVVEAKGFLFTGSLLSEAEQARRILSLWSVGDSLHTLDDGLLLILSKPRRIRCEDAPGLPLVEYDRHPSAIPLSPAELRELHLPHGAVILPHGGRIRVVTLGSASRVDPSLWLELGELTLLQPASLAVPPAPPEALVEPMALELRKKLKGIPKASAMQRETVAALRHAQRQPGALAQWLAGKSTPLRSRSAAGNAEKAGWLRKTLYQLLNATGISALVGMRHGRYIARMMEMFEEGNVAEALRHAIPLGNGGSENANPFLGRLVPRRDLGLTSSRGSSAKSVFVDMDLDQMLRSLYRKAFERLERSGQIDEAAFVLAELLDSSAEAVAFLERHGRLRLAAEVAEARALTADLVVRQWMIAGDRTRAIRLARRHGAFPGAILLLERASDLRAAELREEWGRLLADSGNYAAAVEAVWPVEPLKENALEWMRRAIELGGATAARMRARQLSLLVDDDELSASRHAVRTLLGSHDPESAASRTAFATALLDQDLRTDSTRWGAREAARALIRDAALGLSQIDDKSLERLVTLSGDRTLRADLPTIRFERSDLATRSPALGILIEDAGSLQIFDAVMLPNGRLLVALGEAGARLLTADGRTVAHFNEPASELVASSTGDRAIALARRGAQVRLARLDLLSFRSEFWCDATLDIWSRSYDGATWFAAEGNTVHAIDATAPKLASLWHWPDLDGRVVSIAASPQSCSFLLVSMTGAAGQDDDLRWEQWYIDQTLTLRNRADRRVEGQQLALPVVSSNGSYAQVMRAMSTSDRNPCAMIDGRLTDMWEYSTGETPADPTFSPDWLAVPTTLGGVCFCTLIHRWSMKVRARIALHGATRLALRFCDDRLVIADDGGRVVVVDTGTGRVLRNLRL